MKVSYISEKKFLIPSSFFTSWRMMNLCLDAVTNADTYHSLNLSTILRYILGDLSIWSSFLTSLPDDENSISNKGLSLCPSHKVVDSRHSEILSKLLQPDLQL